MCFVLTIVIIRNGTQGQKLLVNYCYATVLNVIKYIFCCSLIVKEAPVSFHLPALSQQPLDDAIDEIELLGFPLCNVFELVDNDRNTYLSAWNIYEKEL